MRVFDRAAEIVGDERAKEMQELMWFRELLSVEGGAGFGEGVDEVLDDELQGELDRERVNVWEGVDGRELGHYWEQNDGEGKEFGLVATRKYWVGKKDIACGVAWGVNDVCVCRKCGG